MYLQDTREYDIRNADVTGKGKEKDGEGWRRVGKDGEGPRGRGLMAEDCVGQDSPREAELWKLGAAMVRLLSA